MGGGRTTARPSRFGVEDDRVVAAVSRQEHSLLSELAAGAGVTAVVGTASWVLGRRSGRDGVASFGRQSLAWAAVDMAIVAGGRRSPGRPPVAADRARRRASRLRTLTLVNAVLDVGYVVGGAALARHDRRRGDGLAIVVQGLFLLWLDGRHTRWFDALTRDG